MLYFRRELRKVGEEQCVLKVGESLVHLRIDSILIILLRLIFWQWEVAGGVNSLSNIFLSLCFVLAVTCTTSENIFDDLELVGDGDTVTVRADFGECSNILMREHRIEISV